MEIVVAAVIAAVPATIAAVSSAKTNRRIRTNHGKNIGQHVEDLGSLLAQHTIQDAANFAEIRQLLEDQAGS